MKSAAETEARASDGKWTHGSSGAHNTLESHGFSHDGGNKYSNEKLPGHTVEVRGHVDAGGGRKKVKWSHTLPDGRKLEGTGIDQLDHHLTQEKRRARTS